MADADLSYDFGDIPRFVEELERGAQPGRCHGSITTWGTRFRLGS
jgi:hypothetical protein